MPKHKKLRTPPLQRLVNGPLRGFEAEDELEVLLRIISGQYPEDVNIDFLSRINGGGIFNLTDEAIAYYMPCFLKLIKDHPMSDVSQKVVFILRNVSEFRPRLPSLVTDARQRSLIVDIALNSSVYEPVPEGELRKELNNIWSN